MPVISRLLDRMDESVMKTFSEETVKTLVSAPDAVTCELKRDQSVKGRH